MIGIIISHPYLFLLTLFLLGIISYLLFELRSATANPSFGDKSNGARMIFGSVVIIIALLLQYTSVIDGVAGKLTDAQLEPSSLSALKKLCASAPPQEVLGTVSQTGCTTVSVLFYFSYVVMIIGLISLLVSFVHSGKNI